jgi:hypothetical protein
LEIYKPSPEINGEIVDQLIGKYLYLCSKDIDPGNLEHKRKLEESASQDFPDFSMKFLKHCLSKDTIKNTLDLEPRETLLSYRNGVFFQTRKNENDDIFIDIPRQKPHQHPLHSTDMGRMHRVGEISIALQRSSGNNYKTLFIALKPKFYESPNQQLGQAFTVRL